MCALLPSPPITPVCEAGPWGIENPSTRTCAGLIDQLAERHAHGRETRLADIDPIDFRIDSTIPTPMARPLRWISAIEIFALGGGKLLAVVETRKLAGSGKNDGGGHDGTGQRAAAGFIDAGDTGVLFKKGLIEFEERRIRR